MNAVIVELHKEIAAALCDDGCIIKIKNQNYSIGQVIEMKKVTTKKSKKLAIWAVSAAMFVIACGTSVYAYTTPYSYVSLDVNPSIEYTLNRFDRVLSVDAVNDDGQEILDQIDENTLKNQTIEDAVSETVAKISKDNYFDGEIKGGIVIATSAKDEEKADELSAELQESVEEDVQNNGDTVEVEVLSVGTERVKQARALGVTPGKLNLVEKLKASALEPDNINLDEWLQKPVREIMKETKDNKKANKTNKPESNNEDVSSSEEDSTTQDTSSDEQNANKEQNAVKVEQKNQSKEQKSNNGQKNNQSVSNAQQGLSNKQNGSQNENKAERREKANPNQNSSQRKQERTTPNNR